MEKDISEILEILNNNGYDLNTFNIDDSRVNRIDVMSSVNWGSNDEESYKKQEEFINSINVKGEGFNIYAFCDSSGFDYWMVGMEESNYCNFVIEYTDDSDETLQAIVEEINKLENLCFNELTDYSEQVLTARIRKSKEA